MKLFYFHSDFLSTMATLELQNFKTRSFKAFSLHSGWRNAHHTSSVLSCNRMQNLSKMTKRSLGWRISTMSENDEPLKSIGVLIFPKEQKTMV